METPTMIFMLYPHDYKDFSNAKGEINLIQLYNRAYASYPGAIATLHLTVLQKLQPIKDPEVAAHAIATAYMLAHLHGKSA